MPLTFSIKFFYVYALIAFSLSQNFIYDSDDWLILKSPGKVYSISEGPFNVYFGTENGIFIYNKFDNLIGYDYKINQGLDIQSSIYYIHYDNFSDQIWLITQDGIFYKNPLFNEYQQVVHHSIDSYNLSSISALGSINKYIIIQYMSSYIFIDSFSGTVVTDIGNFDINNVSWSSSAFSYSSSDIDLSLYYSDEWLFGFREITDKYGNTESVTVTFEDRDLNLWYGTNNGRILKGFKYSNKLSVLDIGPISNVVTSIIDDHNQNWYIATDGQSYRNRQYFNYSKSSKPFLSIWNEYSDRWTYLNEGDFSELSNVIINCLHNIDDYLLAIGTMDGVVIVPFNQLNQYRYFNKRDGLNENIVIDIDHHNQNLFVMTQKGISTYSIINDIVFEKNILEDYGLQDIDMLDMTIVDSKLFFSSRAGLFMLNLIDRDLKKISENIFFKITFHNEMILGLNESLWMVDLLRNKEKVVVFRADGAKDFLISGNYIWLNLIDKVKLVNVDSNESWIYNHNDGFIDTQIFDLGNDGDWVYFLTNQGVIFYNWRGYHN